eukprot:428229-Pelagomonas_calceolata.AAC.5
MGQPGRAPQGHKGHSKVFMGWSTRAGQGHGAACMSTRILKAWGGLQEHHKDTEGVGRPARAPQGHRGHRTAYKSTSTAHTHTEGGGGGDITF